MNLRRFVSLAKALRILFPGKGRKAWVPVQFKDHQFSTSNRALAEMLTAHLKRTKLGEPR